MQWNSPQQKTTFAESFLSGDADDPFSKNLKEKESTNLNEGKDPKRESGFFVDQQKNRVAAAS